MRKVAVPSILSGDNKTGVHSIAWNYKKNNQAGYVITIASCQIGLAKVIIAFSNTCMKAYMYYKDIQVPVYSKSDIFDFSYIVDYPVTNFHTTEWEWILLLGFETYFNNMPGILKLLKGDYKYL